MHLPKIVDYAEAHNYVHMNKTSSQYTERKTEHFALRSEASAAGLPKPQPVEQLKKELRPGDFGLIKQRQLQQEWSRLVMLKMGLPHQIDCAIYIR